MKKVALLLALITTAVSLSGCLVLSAVGTATSVAIETVDVATDIIF